jgi:hypothetical protein
MERLKKKALNLERQRFLGPESETVLDRLHVAVIGLGGGGSHVVQQLAHLGVGNFSLFDADLLEDTNLNRVVGATEKDVERATPKTSIALRLIKGINRTARVQAIRTKWQAEADRLHECDVILGCVDSLVERAQIEATARRYLIPYIDVGMDVHLVEEHYAVGGQVMVSLPGHACLRCMGIISEDVLGAETAHYGEAGPRPQVIWINGVLASLAVGSLVKLVAPWHGNQMPALVEFDGNEQTVEHSQKLRLLTDRVCVHFTQLSDFGDPFWPKG